MSVVCLPRMFQKLTTKSLKGRNPKCIIFDLAGTLCDSKSNGPKDAILQTFKLIRLDLTSQEVRTPTGQDKYSHIKAILQQPSVIQKWTKEFKRPPNDDNVRFIFDKYKDIQIKLLKQSQYTTLLPYTAKVLNHLKKNHRLMYGVTTGYDSEMTHQILKAFAQQGFIPDFSVSADQVKRPRPFSDGIYANLQHFGISPKHTIKIGDTPIDAEEGENANCITVLMAEDSNEMGSQLEKFDTVDAHNYLEALYKTRERLKASGCDYLINNVTQLPDILDDIISEAK